MNILEDIAKSFKSVFVQFLHDMVKILHSNIVIIFGPYNAFPNEFLVLCINTVQSPFGDQPFGKHPFIPDHILPA